MTRSNGIWSTDDVTVMVCRCGWGALAFIVFFLIQMVHYKWSKDEYQYSLTVHFFFHHGRFDERLSSARFEERSVFARTTNMKIN